MNKTQCALNYFLKIRISKVFPENLIYSQLTSIFPAVIFLYLSLGRGSSVCGQANTGANEIKANTVMSGGSMTVWAVPSEQKVRPDDAAETNNLVW